MPQAAPWWRRGWELLTGGLLMSAYTSLHAAEASRILLLSADQLAAALPVIRQKAAAYLAKDDPRRVALDGLQDPNEPTHQAFARVQNALVQSVTGAHAGAHSPVRAHKRRNKDPRGTSRPACDQASGLTKLTDMLGCDQQIAAMAMSEAHRAEDLQQTEVRRFRNLLFVMFLCLFLVVLVLGIIGGLHPAYFPLCVQKQNAATGTKICPSGGGTASTADLPLVLGIGGIGAALAVARNLAGLKPAGVRYSLSVGQGMVKIAFGAITAMLGIIILSTQTNIGFLGSQVGLLTTAVVFGYSQQLFTKMIDQQATDLMKAASSMG